MWADLSVLPECNKGRERVVSEALPAIALTQIDKIYAIIRSPNHPKSSKFSDFSLNEGVTEIFCPSAATAG
jgi:hypothetical protein